MKNILIILLESRSERPDSDRNNDGGSGGDSPDPKLKRGSDCRWKKLALTAPILAGFCEAVPRV